MRNDGGNRDTETKTSHNSGYGYLQIHCEVTTGLRANERPATSIPMLRLVPLARLSLFLAHCARFALPFYLYILWLHPYSDLFPWPPSRFLFSPFPICGPVPARPLVCVREYRIPPTPRRARRRENNAGAGARCGAIPGCAARRRSISSAV